MVEFSKKKKNKTPVILTSKWPCYWAARLSMATLSKQRQICYVTYGNGAAPLGKIWQPRGTAGSDMASHWTVRRPSDVRFDVILIWCVRLAMVRPRAVIFDVAMTRSCQGGHDRLLRVVLLDILSRVANFVC